MIDVDIHPYTFFKQYCSDNCSYYDAIIAETKREQNKRALVKEQIREKNKYEIADVIFNGPATIVFWRDGTKTVVKCTKEDTFSEDAGVALCIAKKMMGYSFHRVLRDAVKKGRMSRNE